MQTAFVHFVAFCSKPPGIIASVFRRTSSATRPPGRWANLRLMAKPERKSRVRCSALFGVKRFLNSNLSGPG